MSQGDFHGYKTFVVETQHLRIECLAEAGPRIVRLNPSWSSENIFAETPDFKTKNEYGEFRFLGGHRLWHAPESMPRTYFPDHHGLEMEKLSDGVRLRGIVESATNIRKTVTIRLSSSRPVVILEHLLENHGQWPITLAPWALTMMRIGGTALLPQPRGNADKNGLLPNRFVVMWPYSRWDDPRLRLGENFIHIKADANPQAFKIGYFNSHGWLGYHVGDVFFIKRFGARRDATYPDQGCNAEVYCSDKMIELESLGLLAVLEPGQSVLHTEAWEMYKETPKEFMGSGLL